jgi:hypothetical protein
MPAVQGLETGKPVVLLATIGKIYLMAQLGAPDLKGIIRWYVFLCHDLLKWQNTGAGFVQYQMFFDTTENKYLLPAILLPYWFL